MIKNQMELIQGWMQDGTYSNMYASYKDYASSGEFNDYRGTVLLEDARKSKSILGLTDEEISDNPIMAQTMMSLLKMAEYGGKGYESAKTNKDVSAMKNVQFRQQKVNADINALSNHRGNRDEFIRSFSGLTSIVDGRSATFGEHMSTDKSRHSVNFIDDLQNSFMDASLISNVVELFTSDEYNEKRNTEKELLRTTPVSGGTVAAILGGVAAFTLESMMFSKFSGGLFKNSAGKAQQMSNWLRFGGQGAALPIMQAVNEQAGLTQKYIGDNEIENDLLAAVADGAHNALGMFVGDAYLTPIIGRVVGIGKFKTQQIMNKTLGTLKKDVAAGSGMTYKDALNKASLSIQKVPALKKEYQKILSHMSGTVDKETMGLAMKEALQITTGRELLKNSLIFAAGDLAADYTFDVLSHNLADMTIGAAVTGDGLFSVSQNRMFSFKEMKAQGFEEALINGLSQRIGMRIGAKVFNGISSKITAGKLDLEEDAAVAGSRAYYDDLFGKNIAGTKLHKTMAWVSGFIGEDFTKRVDLDLRTKSGVSLMDALTTQDDNLNIMNLVNSWYAKTYTGKRTLLKTFEKWDETFESDTSLRWNNKDIKDFELGQVASSFAPGIASVIKGIVNESALHVKDADKIDKAKLVELILEDFTDIEKNFIFENADAKTTESTLINANKLSQRTGEGTGADRVAKNPKDFIDDKVARKLFKVLGIISPKSSSEEDFIYDVGEAVSKEINKRVHDKYKSQIREANSKIADTDKHIIIDEGKPFEVSTVTAVRELLLGKNFPKVGDDAEEDTRLRNKLEAIVGSDNIVSKSKSKNDKLAAIESAKGSFEALNEKSDILGYIEKGLNVDAVTKSMVAIAKDVMKMKPGDVSVSGRLYDDINELMNKSAKQIFRSHIDAIETAMNNKDLTPLGKQRKVLMNVVNASVLAKNVGFRWKDDITNFGEKMNKPDIQAVLNAATKNKELFTKGPLAHYKDDIAGDPEYFSKLVNESMLEMHNVSHAINRLYGIADAKPRIDTQLRIMGVNDTTKDWNRYSRSSIPLFYWDPKADKADIKIEGLEVGTDIEIGMDTKINVMYTDYMNSPNKLKSHGLEKEHVLEMVAAAAIKNLDYNYTVSQYNDRMAIEGLDNITGSVRIDSEGKYFIEMDTKSFNELDESHLQKAYQYIHKSFSAKRDTRAMRDYSVKTQPTDPYKIGSKTVTAEGFFKDLSYKSIFSNLNMTHLGIRLLQGSKSLDEATKRLMDVIGHLDPSAVRGKENLEMVEEMSKAFLSEKSGLFATEVKIDLALKTIDGIPTIVTKNTQVNVAPIGNIGDVLDGRVQVVSLEIDEKISVEAPTTIKVLEDANIIPLSKEFKNNLDSVWIRVPIVGEANKMTGPEIASMKSMLMDSMVDKLSRKGATQTVADLTGTKDIAPQEPKSFEAMIIKELLAVENKGDAADDAVFVKNLYEKAITFEEKAITNWKKNNSKYIERTEVKTAKQIKGVHGDIDHIMGIVDALKNNKYNIDINVKAELDGLKKSMADAMKGTISDEKMVEIESSYEAIIAKIDKKVIDATSILIRDSEIVNRSEDLDMDKNFDAYDTRDLNDFRLVDELKDAVEDTVKAVAAIKKEIGDDKGNPTQMRRHFYTLLAFNEAAISAKTLQKRISYMFSQSNIMKKGQMPPAFEADLETFMREMHAGGDEAKQGKIYLTVGRQDGTNYIPKFLYNILQSTIGLTGGKYTMNTSVGGKYMMRDNAEVIKTEQKIRVVGGGVRQIRENDVLLDLSSLKTLYPEFLNSLDFKGLNTEDGKRGNAVEIDFGEFVKDGVVNEKAKKLFADLSLHAALKASSREKDPSAQMTNLGTTWDQGIALGNTDLAVKNAIDSINKAFTSADMIKNSEQLQGIFRSFYNRNSNLGSTFVAEKFNSLRIGYAGADGKGDRNDLELYSNKELFGKTLSGKHLNPGAEGIIGTKALAEQAREYLAKGHVDGKDKKAFEALILYFDKVSFYGSDLKDATKILQDSGVINTFKNHVTTGELKRMSKDAQTRFGDMDKQSKLHKNNSTIQDIFDRAGLMMLNIMSGSDDGSRKGFFTSLDMNGTDKLMSNKASRRKVFMINATRFPNHNAGQNTMVFLKGIALGGQGFAIKDTWYTKIFGGDWDGDTIQFLAKDKNDLKKARVNGNLVFGDTDEQILQSIFDWHYDAYGRHNLQKGVTIKGDVEGGSNQNPGGPIAGLRLVKFITGFFKLEKSAFESIITNAMGSKTMEAAVKDSEGKIFQRDLITTSLDPDNKGNDLDLSIIDPIVKSTGTSVASMGSLKDITTSEVFTIGKKDYKMIVGHTKDTEIGYDETKDMYRQVTLLLEMDSADFGFKIAGAWSQKVGNKDKMLEARATIPNAMGVMVNGLSRKFFKEPSREDQLDKNLLAAITEKMPAKVTDGEPNIFLGGLIGKRALNVDILNLQANSVGVDNVKEYGLYLLEKRFGIGAKQVVGDLVKTIALSSHFQIADFHSGGASSRLNVFNYKVQGKNNSNLVAQNEKFSGLTSKFINEVRQSIDNDGSGRYMTSDDYEALLELKKNKTATTKDMLRAIGIVEKYESKLFALEETLSTLDPDIVGVIKITRALKEQFRPAIQKALDHRADDGLRAKLAYTEKFGLFHATDDKVVDGMDFDKKINYYDQLLHLTALEGTIKSFSKGFGEYSGMRLYRDLLTTPAAIGKNVATEEQFLNMLFRDMNDENTTYTPGITRSVKLNSVGDVKTILRDLGITFKPKTKKSGFAAAMKAWATAGGDGRLVEKLYKNIMDSEKLSGESQFSLAFVDKKGESMSLSNVYELLRNGSYDKSNEKLLLVTHLIRNLSDTSQLAVKLLDEGMDISAVDKFLDSAKESGTTKYSIADIDRMEAHRSKALNEKFGILDNAVSQKVTQMIVNQKLTEC